MATRIEATIEDLYNAPRDNGTYELVNGELVHMSPTGFEPGRISFRICVALSDYEEETDSGYALPGNVAFLVDLPRRKSFSPDAAYTFHAPDNLMRFVEGAPAFAAEPALQAITVPPPIVRIPRNGAITSRRARSPSGTWTR